MAVELASAYVSITASARGIGKSLTSELGDVDGIGRDAGDRTAKGFVGRFTSGLGGIALAVGGAFAAVQIGGFLKDSITQASDLSESMSKVGIVFGDSAGEIKDWAKTASKSLGQSSQQALEAAGTFGNLFVSMKIATPQAAKMSKKMIELAGDLASFNNVSPEEALDALRSGLVGETEPLRRFGVNLNEATLKAKAMALGLSDGKTTLDASAKAQASYALILEQTGTAQGDFARTSGGLANQQRILAAQFLDLKAQIGKEFEPAVVAVARVLTESVIPAFTEFVDWVGPRARGAIADFKAELDGIGAVPEGIFARLGDAVGIIIRLFGDGVPDAVRSFVDGFKEAGEGVDKAGLDGKFETIGGKLRALVDLVKDNDALFKPIIAAMSGMAAALLSVSAASTILTGLTAAFNGLEVALALLASPIGIFVVAIGLLAGGFVLAYQKIKPFQEAVDSVLKVFKERGFGAAVTEAGVQMGRLWDIVRPKLDEFIAKIGPWLEAHAPGILEGLKSAWVGFATFMGTEFFPFLAEKLGVLLAQFGGWIVDTAAPWLKDKLLEWARAFGDWVSESAWPWLLNKLPQLIKDLGQWVKDNKPLLVAQLVEWGNAFADWVEKEAIPKLKQKLPGIISAIAEWVVTTAIPQLYQFGVNMAFALLQFAAITAAGMPAELGRITLALVNWAFDLLVRIPPMMAGVGSAIARALVNPIIRAWNGLSFTIGGGSFAGVNLPSVTLTTPYIRELAAGGAFSAATLAVIGENSSRSNPEIATARDVMEETFERVLSRMRGGGSVTINTLGRPDAHELAREVAWQQKTAGV